MSLKSINYRSFQKFANFSNFNISSRWKVARKSGEPRVKIQAKFPAAHTRGVAWASLAWRTRGFRRPRASPRRRRDAGLDTSNLACSVEKKKKEKEKKGLVRRLHPRAFLRQKRGTRDRKGKAGGGWRRGGGGKKMRDVAAALATRMLGCRSFCLAMQASLASGVMSTLITNRLRCAGGWSTPQKPKERKKKGKRKKHRASPRRRDGDGKREKHGEGKWQKCAR